MSNNRVAFGLPPVGKPCPFSMPEGRRLFLLHVPLGPTAGMSQPSGMSQPLGTSLPGLVPG